LQARIQNEKRLLLSRGEKLDATKEGVVRAGIWGGLTALGIQVGFKLEDTGLSLSCLSSGLSEGGTKAILDHQPDVVGTAIGYTAATTCYTKGGAMEKLKKAAAMAPEELAIGAAYWAAWGQGAVMGASGASLGAFGRIGERAMVGYIDTEGSKLDKAAGGAAFGAKHSVAEGVGYALKAILGAAVPTPMLVVDEDSRKGIRFSGGTDIIVGTRSREDIAVAIDSKVDHDQGKQLKEKGVQARLGGGLVLSPIGLAVGGIIGAAAGDGIGAAVGVGGNVGCTKATELNYSASGLVFLSERKLKGFGGSFDVAGVEWLKLDTGVVRVIIMEEDELGHLIREQRRSLVIAGIQVHGWDEQEDWKDKLMPGDEVEIRVFNGTKAQWVRSKISRLLKNGFITRYGNQGDEVHRVVSLKSSNFRPPLDSLKGYGVLREKQLAEKALAKSPEHGVC